MEANTSAAQTFARNFGCEVVASPIEEMKTYPDADVILGGPPCPGFQPPWPSAGRSSRASALNSLWQHYLGVVRQVQPRAFVIENVPQFQKSSQFEHLVTLMRTDGVLSQYGFSFGVLNAADYGVPQNRRRGIFLAVRGADEVPSPPPASHGTAETPWRTVREAISDSAAPAPMAWSRSSMPAVDSTSTSDATRRNARWRGIGRSPKVEIVSTWRGEQARVALTMLGQQANRPYRCDGSSLVGSTPSVTIRTEFYKPEKGRYLHPTAHHPICHWEAARLQGFGDDFVFEGTKDGNRTADWQRRPGRPR